MLKPEPYFIAELSANHGGKLETATKIISQVASSGASAIKLQTFTADQMAVRNESNLLPKSSKLWAGKNLWELMKEAEMPLSWHSQLFNLAKTLGLEAFSTPYNPESVEFLMTMGASAIKVSSFDVINVPLLEEVAKSRLPIILSTGMATLEEIRTAVSILVRFGSQVTILKCTSSYPCAPQDANLAGILTLKDEFGLDVGFSDHTLGSQAAIVARSLGAVMFEKHVKLSEGSDTLDSEFSLTPIEFKRYVEDVTQVDTLLGSSQLGPIAAESASLWERPSVIALKEIREGEILSTKNLGIRRPSIGAKPEYYSRLLGQKSSRDFKAGEGVVES